MNRGAPRFADVARWLDERLDARSEKEAAS